MDAIQLTAKLLEARVNGFECCYAPSPRPFSHWDNHCVNCGIHAGLAHHRDDCPPQHYEEAQSKPLQDVKGDTA